MFTVYVKHDYGKYVDMTTKFEHLMNMKKEKKNVNSSPM